MTGIAYPGGGTNTFVYNGLDQWVGKTHSAGTFTYTLDGDSVDADVLRDGAAVYNHGLGLVSEVGGGTSKFYHADALGTTRAISDGGQSTSDTT